MSTFRIELRSYNIGATRESTVGTGYAHNFLVLIEVAPDLSERAVAEFHGGTRDEKTEYIDFDAIGGGKLIAHHRLRDGQPPSKHYVDSKRHPSFTLFEGSKEEALERWRKAQAGAAWIEKNHFTYWPLGTNSNTVVNTLARAMGFEVTGQPIDRATGRHIEAPGSNLDLAKGRSDAPKPFTDKPVRVFGYGDEGTSRERPIPPEREAPPYDGPELRRRGASPAEATPAAFALGFENARRFADEHRFDPRAEPAPSKEQNKIISAWVERVLAPAISHAQLPEGLAGDVLDHAASMTPHAASLVLQRGLNRLAGPAEFGAAAPAFAGGASKRVTEDGWIGPETLAATRHHAAEQGIGKVREAVGLAAFQRGLDALAKGEASADDAPSVFHRSIGRLYREPDGIGGSAAPRPAWASTQRHEDVATLQDALNDANRIFGFADRPLKVDGDLGPQTGAALAAAARAAGPERLTDHVAKRLGIGEPGLMDNPARGFDYALNDAEEQDGAGDYEGLG